MRPGVSFNLRRHRLPLLQVIADMDALTNTAVRQIRVKNKTGNPGSAFVKTSIRKLVEVFLLVHHHSKRQGVKQHLLYPLSFGSNHSVGTQFPSQNLLVLSPLDLTTPNFRVPLVVPLSSYLISIITGDELKSLGSGNVLDGHQHVGSFRLHCSHAVVFKARGFPTHLNPFETKFV